MNPIKDKQPILKEEQQLALLATDYIAAGNNKIDLETAKQEVTVLLEQCRRFTRKFIGGVIQPKETWKDPSGSIYVDGALLVRFLVGKGVKTDD